MIKYKTCRYDAKIEQVECTKETPHFVTIKYYGRDRRVAKMSDYDCYHDSWKDAKDHLLSTAKIRLERDQKALEFSQGVFDAIAGLNESSTQKIAEKLEG